MGVIAALLPHPVRLQRLRAAIRDRHTLTVCEDWSALTRVCAESPVHLAVFDLYADGAANFDRVRVLKLRFPRVALLAYSSVDASRVRDLFDAGRCGIDGLIVADHDDEGGRVLALVEQAEARSIASHLRRVVEAEQALVRDAVLAAVTRAHERLTPETLARLLLVPRRVLARRLQDSRFPPPHQLITWGRLIVAAHMLEDGSRSADAVANALEFPSGSAFRNTCQRYLRASPQQIRARGGGTFVIEAFLARRGEMMESGDAEEADDSGADEAAE